MIDWIRRTFFPAPAPPGPVQAIDPELADTLRVWVWSGLYRPSEVASMAVDLLEESDHGRLPDLRAFATGEFRRKAQAEPSWPDTTDCDRLDAIFTLLDGGGVCVVQNAGYTMSDGYSDVAETVASRPDRTFEGYCFYHGQDLARAVNGDGLMLAFGDLEDTDAGGLKIGERVRDAFEGAGFRVVWDGTVETRIDLPDFDWKRRFEPA